MCGISPKFFFKVVTVFDGKLVAGKHSNIYSDFREKLGRELHARGKLTFCN